MYYHALLWKMQVLPPVFRQQMVGTARGFTSGCLFFPLSYL